MERIQQLTVRHLEVPLDTPVWVGGYEIHKRDYCYLEISTNEGRVGRALAFARGGDLAAAVAKNMAPLLRNERADQIEKLWARLYDGTRLIGRQGLFMRALSLVDLALWDLKAQQAALPLHQLLGGYRDCVPVLMAGGYYAPDKGIEQLIREYKEYVEDGFTNLKLMVGGASMEEDLQRFIALRQSLPSSVSLAVDANGSWDDPKAVLRWINKAQLLGGEISFVEEPLPPDQQEGTAWLRERTEVSVAIGEFMAGRWAFQQLFHRHCTDIVRADATLCGGITEWKRIASMADACYLPLIPHYYASIHFHLAMAFPGCRMIEMVSSAGKNSSYDWLMGRTFEFKSGIAYPKDRPGFGFEPDPDAIEASTVYRLSV